MISDLATTLDLLLRISTLLAFSIVSQVYVVSGITSSELFPTPLRSISYSWLQVISRVGVVIAPQLFILVSNKTVSFVPLVQQLFIMKLLHRVFFGKFLAAFGTRLS